LQLKPSAEQQRQDIAQKLIELYPDDSEVSTLVANAQGLVVSSADNEELELKNQLYKEPNNAATSYQLGIFYANTKRWSEAQAAFFKAVSLDSGQSEYLANLAISYDQLGKSELAIATYQRALDALKTRPSLLNQEALLARLNYLTQQSE
jgi:uncharacterized protein HemY